MSIIKCTECGEKISEHAANCVYCGCPMEQILQEYKIRDAFKLAKLQKQEERRARFKDKAINILKTISGISLYQHIREEKEERIKAEQKIDAILSQLKESAEKYEIEKEQALLLQKKLEQQQRVEQEERAAEERKRQEEIAAKKQREEELRLQQEADERKRREEIAERIRLLKEQQEREAIVLKQQEEQKRKEINEKRKATRERNKQLRIEKEQRAQSLKTIYETDKKAFLKIVNEDGTFDKFRCSEGAGYYKWTIQNPDDVCIEYQRIGDKMFITFPGTEQILITDKNLQEKIKNFHAKKHSQKISDLTSKLHCEILCHANTSGMDYEQKRLQEIERQKQQGTYYYKTFYMDENGFVIDKPKYRKGD